MPLSSTQLHRKPARANVCAVLVNALEERHRNFTVQLARVRRRPSEPGVHDLRVATRRLIAIIDLAAEIGEGQVLLRSRKTLRSLLKGFNALRDVHIQKIALSKLRGRFPATAMVVRDVRIRERGHLRAAVRSIRQFDAGGLQSAMGEMEDGLLKIGINPAHESASHVMVMGLLARKFAGVVRRREMLSAANPVTVHRMRVAFKKYRYSLEILVPLLPWAAAVTRKRLNAYQTSMGKIQDTVAVLQGITSFEKSRPMTGRMALIGVRQYLLRRRMALTEAFLAEADAVYGFWR